MKKRNTILIQKDTSIKMINIDISMIVSEVKNKYKNIYKEYGFGEEHSKRIKEELNFIVKHDSLVKDVIHFINNGITGGVKNTPNSLVLFVLGVTNILPDMKKDFFFKFVVDTENSRISAPDIDIDFEHREAILDHLCDLYGRDKVALIGTAIGFKPKAAVQFAAKALDVTKTAKEGDRRFSSENTQEGIRLSKIMPNLPGVNLRQWLGEDPNFKPPRKCEEPMRLLKEEVDKYPEVFETAKRLEGIFKSYGTHAAGVVISFNPIVDDVPLHYARVKDDGGFDVDNDFDDETKELNLMTTQYNMEEVESLGLLKFDFLQLNNLRQMRMVEELVKEKEGYLPFDLDKLETNDDEVFKLIDSKNPTKLEGLFQISGKAFAGQDFQKKNWDTGELEYNKDGTPKINHRKGVIEIIGCKNFNDIVAPNALGRPGPLNCDMHTKYAEAKKHPEDIEYSHPALKSILENSYGQLCYQEQLTQMAQVLAGFSYGEADMLRKACAKKKKEYLEKIKPKFYDGCRVNKVSEKVIDEMWSITTEFGQYAFNLSHCLSGENYVYDKKSKEYIKIKNVKEGMVLDTFLDGRIVEDTVLELIDSGNQDVYEIILSNGQRIEATLDHKFLCEDLEYRTVSEIIEGDFDILFDDQD